MQLISPLRKALTASRRKSQSRAAGACHGDAFLSGVVRARFRRKYGVLEPCLRALARIAAIVELGQRILDDQSQRSAGYWKPANSISAPLDLIIGIWNGEPAAGIGGTADVLGKPEN